MDLAIEQLNRKVQAILGALVFAVSFIVYWSTVAPTTSFWDCGEFIASSYTLSVIHPPGAPLYLLIGRLLTMIPIFKDIGLRVNMFSVFISAATIFLMYLIIVQLILRWRGAAQNMEDRLISFGSAAFGALAYAFTDSQWFNAVEAEVYGFSLFFTALVVWLALYWGERSEKSGNMLLIFFIFYMFGLATGVHLLNILAFPFVLLVAYFHDNKTVRRLLMILFLQIMVPTLIYVLFFQFDPAKLGMGMLEHQEKAFHAFTWIAGIWGVITLSWLYRNDRRAFAAWWVIPVLGAIGYSTYLMIYIRAGMNPPINENNPSTIQGMMDYLARKQYGQESMMLTFMHRKADFWNYQIQTMYTRYFGWQFIGKGTLLDFQDRIIEVISFRGLYGIPFLVGLWGAVHHFQRDWKRALAVLVLFILTGYAIIIYLNQPDPQPRERDYSYCGSFFAFALWIGVGMAGILEWVSDLMRKSKASLRLGVQAVIAVILVIIVPVNLIVFNYAEHDRSGNYVASDYSYNILETCEPDAIIFTNGDNDTFPLWYLQEVEGVRRDVRVVNLSLLNTPWYIYQLRDIEPKVPIRMSDKAIDEVDYRRWETRKFAIDVAEHVRKEQREELLTFMDESQLPEMTDKIVWDLKPTYPDNNPMVLRVQDLMILRILLDNQWKRPVYFAVTVAGSNMLGMDDYLRMDGLAFKIVPYKNGDNIAPPVLQHNVEEKYRYRGLADQNVYLNIGAQKLLQNYRSAFMRLASYYLQEGDDNDEAGRILKKMDDLIPDSHVHYHNEWSAFLIGDLFNRAGLDARMEERTQNVVPGRQMGNKERLQLALYYSHWYQMYDKAEAILKELLAENPNDNRVYSELFFLYKKAGRYAEAVAFMENWLGKFPADSSAYRELQEVRKLAAMDTSNQSSNLDFLDQ